MIVGWEWTPDVQSDPTKVSAAVDKLKAELPGVKIRVVNRDENPSVPAGISIGKDTLVRPKEDGSLEVDPDALNRMKDATGGKPPDL